MFSGNNLMPHSQIVVVVLIGWFLGRMRRSANRRAESESSTTAIIKCTAAVVWCMLTWTAYEYYQFALSDDYVLTTAGPRFWFDSRSVYYAP